MTHGYEWFEDYSIVDLDYEDWNFDDIDEAIEEAVDKIDNWMDEYEASLTYEE